MRPRHLVLPAAALLLAPLLAACGSSTEESKGSPSDAAGFPARVERCGRTITVDAPPQRIASLNQGSTEILLSLGLADRMVGTAGWTDPILPSLADANDDVTRLADQAPSYEDLLATEPDLVTASFGGTLGQGGVTTPAQLAKVGVPSYLSAVECEKSELGGTSGDGTRDELLTLDSIATEVRDLATLTGTQDKGTALVTSLQKRMAAAEKSTFDDVSVLYWFANSEAPYVAGCCGGPGLVSDALGLTNVFADETAEWPQIGWESIAEADPDVLVIGDLTRKSQTAETAKAKIAFLESNPVTREMTAVKKKRYILLAGAEMNPSIRTVDAVEKVAAGLRKLGYETS